TKWQVIDGPDGDRLLDRLRPGSVRKMSIGYGAGSHDFVDLTVGKARNLREVKLREGSLVVFPMNEVADVDRASVKALIAEIEDRLDGDLTDEDREALQKARDEIDRALQPAQPEGLAPDDPKRLAVETLARRLRTSNLRRLATR
ncbi:MAG: HK97 family phage prohead protease, partial [Gemmatimonadota bacterium]